ncbi:YczE/YyaS/YitT family protein [Saccharothrix lopnurensis]|uniref:YitT family protein n=1 Tax=Saccharothrix lopnurensis TaxID=1670621 RepID=A0ABW1P9A1_9PSEU
MTGIDRRAVASRVVRLLGGTMLMGVAVAALVRAQLGLLPLDVLHLAVGRHTGWTLGGAFIAVQATLLMIYLPLRIRPGTGTVAAAVIPALSCDVVLASMPAPQALAWRLLLLVTGGALFAVGVALYLGARMGTLPRDGLMLELHRRHPRLRPAPIRVVADATCLLAGWSLLGPITAVVDGTVGPATLLLTALLGPGIAFLVRRIKPYPTCAPHHRAPG